MPGRRLREDGQSWGRCPPGEDGQGLLPALEVREEAPRTEFLSEPVEGTNRASTLMEDRWPLIVRK